MISSAAAVAAVGLLAACGDQQAGGGGGQGAGQTSVVPGPELTGVQWGVESLTVGGKKAEPPRGGAYFEIKKNGEVQGTFGCNSFSGKVDLAGGTLKVGSLARTEMYCGDDFEERAFGVFEGELKAEQAGQKVKLTGEGGDFITLAKVEPAPLTGTEWQVTAVLEGDTAASLPKGAKARLTFGKDGRVTGSLGCNRVNAKATVHDDGTLTLGPAGTTRKMCPDDVMKTERALLGLFDGKSEYKITHRTLHLTKGDTGLTATAGKG
ncbi:META domain-containing protein [Streptomyces indicus]|uniref:META domain-containing protein n=1 Tax=Streptomyces indicus TaxID=417292 RepID=UPI000D1C1438|nr:META domain-containing protein [Streptomyces indicus]